MVSHLRHPLGGDRGVLARAGRWAGPDRLERRGDDHDPLRLRPPFVALDAAGQRRLLTPVGAILLACSRLIVGTLYIHSVPFGQMVRLC